MANTAFGRVQAYELSVLTGTQVLLLVVSETGLVYTFTTPKLQPLVTKAEGKNLIQVRSNPASGRDRKPELTRPSSRPVSMRLNPPVTRTASMRLMCPQSRPRMLAIAMPTRRSPGCRVPVACTLAT